MKKNIFYSWQSDLPNNTNRGLIEDSIKIALKEISNDNIHLDIVIDRDTQGVSGTPDIANSIFKKIDNSSIFIADISFINSQSTDRKCPNPNVLIELGYAAKTIGWNNIICLFNIEFGRVEDLPFELRFRRPLTYKVENKENKTKDRKSLAGSIKNAILNIIKNESAKDEIRDYIKLQVDNEIFTVCNHSLKIFNGYDSPINIQEIYKLFSLTKDDIQRELYERKYLGFTVLKDWLVYKAKIEEIINQPFFTQNAEPIYVSSLIKVVRGLEIMATVYKDNALFEDLAERESKYDIVEGRNINPDNPKDSYLLLRNIEGKSQGIVIDYGIIRPFNKHRLLNYQTIGGEKFLKWSSGFYELFKCIENWIENTGNYLIIDPLTHRT
ncbi:MAG: hypothetical protein WCO13_06195 [Bacteroidota bacterium]